MSEKKSFARGYSMIAAWFVMWAVLNFITNQSISVYRDTIAELKGFDTSFLLKFSSYASVITTILVLVLPTFLNRIGSKAVTIFGIIAAGVTYIILPLVNNQTVFAILIALEILWGLIYASIGSMVMVSKWFPRKKGAIMGIITGASILSGSIFLPIFSVINKKSGIQTAMIIMGAAITLFGIICIFWLKETPQELDLLPDNMPMTEEEKEHLLAGTTVKSEWSYKQMLKDWHIWTVSLGWGFALLSIGAISLILYSFLTSIGVSYDMVILTMTIGGLLTTVGSFLSGFIDQKFGNRITGIIAIGILTLAFVIMAFWTSAPAIVGIIAVLLVMTVAGACNNLVSSQVLSIYGPKSFSNAMTLSTLLMCIRQFGTLIDAKSLEMTGNYQAGFVLVVALLVLGIIFVWISGDKLIPAPSEK